MARKNTYKLNVDHSKGLPEMCLSGDNCLTCELSECLLDKRQRKADARKAATEEAKQKKKKVSDEIRKQKSREYNRLIGGIKNETD